MRPKEIRTFRCHNPNSKFRGVLPDSSIDGVNTVNFVFNSVNEKAYWPLNISYYELIKDGWKEENEKI